MSWIKNLPEREVREMTLVEPGTVCISITDPQRPERLLPALEGFAALLRLRFCDIDTSDAARTRLHRRQCRDCGDETEHAMTAEQADEIVQFVRANPNRNILVHCAAGISRSAAVAKALTEAYPWYEDKTWEGAPNEHVLSLMRKAFGLPRRIRVEE